MTALDRLAERCGIQSSSTDVFGDIRIVSSELKRALLAAMNYPVNTEVDAELALEAIESREWSSSLPPVLVVVENTQVVIPVNVSHGVGELRWTLILEGGNTLSGHAPVRDLRVVKERPQANGGLLRVELALALNLPTGYHSLRLDEHDGELSLVITPGKCWLPDEGDGYWGLATSLFLIRSERNWGIGDFTDLAELGNLAHSKQADLVGLNPLHAMFLDDAEQASPYSPSDRILLNVLNIDVDAIPELACSEPARQLIASEPFQQRLATARNSLLVEYATVAELKLGVLKLLFVAFEQAGQSSRAQQFQAFHKERRTLLDRACLFQAMREYFSGQSSAQSSLQAWPEDCRNAGSPGARRFAAEHAGLVRFHVWLQWIADSQLKEAAQACGGMAIGLYRDLAVGSHPAGAEIWSYPDAFVAGAMVGAPPDLLSPEGQNWGLPPLNPIVAREHAYTSFIELLRSNMRHAGGLRIDHAMALLRLYWIPNGNKPGDGAYVHYPLEDLIGIIALESNRNRCLVVGEDLGTVPAGFRERLNAANILSYRVLFFEKDGDGFLSPEAYPRLALSVAGNHDLATVRGWWTASDIDLKDRLGLFPRGAGEAHSQRAADKQALIKLMVEQGLLSCEPPDEHGIVDVVHALLGRTRSLITMVQIDDLTGEEEQMNIPGTTNEHANWRRRLSRTIEELSADPRFNAVARRLSDDRRSAAASLVR